MISKKFILFNLLSLLVLVFVPVLVFAASGLIPCDGPKGIDGTPCDLKLLLKLAGTIIHYVVFVLMPIVATVAILLIGIKIISNPEKVNARSEGIKLAETIVLGMVIIFSAYLIMQAIVNSLATGSGIGQTLRNLFN